jgi:hypothetical protein
MAKEFVTKDSGKRAAYTTGMVRDTDEGKPNFYLVTPKLIPYEEQMLTRWAKLMTRGAVKYSKRNWEKASTQEELDRFQESAFRHFMQWLLGDVEEDHAAACYFNIQCAEYVRWRMEHGKGERQTTIAETHTGDAA